MNKKNEQQDDSSSGREPSGTPFGGVLPQVVKKIKHQPFLFVIGVIVLLIGLTVTSRVGSTDLRFLVAVIALLAFAAVVGYYFFAGRQMGKTDTRERDQAVRNVPISAVSPKYEVRVTNSKGVVTGDHARVEMDLRESESDRSRKGYSPRNDLNPQELRSSLELQLESSKRNLEALLAKKAVYAEGEVPLTILNAIKAEENAMQSVKAKLAALAE